MCVWAHQLMASRPAPPSGLGVAQHPAWSFQMVCFALQATVSQCLLDTVAVDHQNMQQFVTMCLFRSDILGKSLHSPRLLFLYGHCYLAWSCLSCGCQPTDPERGCVDHVQAKTSVPWLAMQCHMHCGVPMYGSVLNSSRCRCQFSQLVCSVLHTFHARLLFDHACTWPGKPGINDQPSCKSCIIKVVRADIRQ